MMTSQPNKDLRGGSQDAHPDWNDAYRFWFNASACALGSISIFAAMGNRGSIFDSPDRSICFGLVIFGLSIALVLSKWRGMQTNFRVWFAILFFASAVLLITLTVVFSTSFSSQIAVSTVLTGWCIVRLKGESYWQSLLLGLAISVPLWIDFLTNRGFFNNVESTAITATSLLANRLGLPNASNEQAILFLNGTACEFTAIGNWDSVVSLYGVALFFVLVLRRNLLVSLLTIGLSTFVWIAVRTTGWVTLVCLSNWNETWYPWSFGIQIGFFSIAVLMIFSLDQFLAHVFMPIPVKQFHPEAPRCAFVWNWLCELPKLQLRLPRQNAIAIRWRTLVKSTGKSESFWTDMNWLLVGVRGIRLHPIASLAGMIFAWGGWKRSRNWRLYFLHLPTIVLLVGFYAVLGLLSSYWEAGTADFLSAESGRMCPTSSLENACQQKQEAEFSRTIGTASQLKEDTFDSLNENTLRFIELISQQVLSVDPANSNAQYRLALTLYLLGQFERAERDMRQIVENKLVSLPQAHAWLAKEMIIQQGEEGEHSRQELMAHLEIARKWKDVDCRLMFLYVRLLEEQGDYSLGLKVAEESFGTKPEFQLHLAKLYERIGDTEERISAAKQAESYYLMKINTNTASESDRLSIANARLLSNQPEQAAKVLSDGIRQHQGGERAIKLLFEIQRMQYTNSIKKNELGKFEMDLRLLEQMLETDALNPGVSTEIAKLIEYGVVPTKRLKEVLARHIQLGIISAPALILIGEAYFRKGKLEDAKRHWEMAIVKEPDNYEGLNDLAVCLVAISAANADRAIELVSKANDISPNNADILDTWGEVLLAANRPREAVNKLESAIRKDSNRIDTRKKLIAAYDAIGMKEMVTAQKKVLLTLEKNKDQQKTTDTVSQ